MLSKRNLKNYDGKIVKVNFKDDAGYIAGLVSVVFVHGKAMYYNIGGEEWAVLLSLNAIKDFEVINNDALEKSKKRLQKANGRKLNGNGKIKKILRNTSARRA